MLLTCVAFLSCVERSGVFHVVQEKFVKCRADLQSGAGLSLATVYAGYLCSESCNVF